MDPSQLVDVVFKVFNNGTLAEARRWETECSSSGSCAESKSPTRGRLPRELSGKDSPPMLEVRIRSPSQEDPLEKEVAAHSSILAWKSPWMEEPGGLHGVPRSQTRLSDWAHWLVGPEPHAHHGTKGQITHLGVIWSEWGEGRFSQGSQGKEWVGAGDRVPVT